MHPLALLEPHQLGWLGANPHLWLPPALLLLFFVGLALRRLRRPTPEESQKPAPAEEPEPHPEKPSEPVAPKLPEGPPPPSDTPLSGGVPTPAAAVKRLPEEPPPASFATGMAKTRSGLLGRLSGLFARPRLDEALYEDLEEVLITSDVGPRTSAALIERLRGRAQERGLVTAEALRALLKEELRALLDKAPPAPASEIPEGPRPWVIMVNGVNGTGKTTTIGKLAHRLRAQGRSVLLGAADTFRAAATEQLASWAERTGAELVRGRSESDPGAVAFDAVKAATARRSEVVLIDTAGRLHTKSNLMEELKKLKRVLGKAMGGAPHESWLVIDANTGQNAAAQVREFHEALGLTGLVVAKLDGTAKGGALFGIAWEFGLPIRYAGVGERPGDLIVFDRDAFVDALFEER